MERKGVASKAVEVGVAHHNGRSQQDKFITEGLTYDDVLLVPQMASASVVEQRERFGLRSPQRIAGLTCGHDSRFRCWWLSCWDR